MWETSFGAKKNLHLGPLPVKPAGFPIQRWRARLTRQYNTDNNVRLSLSLSPLSIIDKS